VHSVVPTASKAVAEMSTEIKQSQPHAVDAPTMARLLRYPYARERENGPIGNAIDSAVGLG